MIDLFSRRDAQTTGRYSELVAIAAYTAQGVQVAMPFGNQPLWDLLAFEDGRWQRIQVKTAKQDKNGTITAHIARTVSRRNRKSKRYTSDDIDAFVAVLPETGTIWKIPVNETSGVSMQLGHKFLWSMGALTNFRDPQRIGPRSASCCDSRQKIIALAINERPPGIRDIAWEQFLAYQSGESYASLSKRYGKHPSSIRDKVMLVAEKHAQILSQPMLNATLRASSGRPVN